nr:hypothetical protein Iba_chr11bCG14690 [Ipomoea batatas]GMD54486.1 hypothetical protein Iba_chr11cCG12590 [Ipomoea batatas]
MSCGDKSKTKFHNKNIYINLAIFRSSRTERMAQPSFSQRVVEAVPPRRQVAERRPSFGKRLETIEEESYGNQKTPFLFQSSSSSSAKSSIVTNKKQLYSPWSG